ncbi:MAG: ABC transporter ATP-binding protein, partial [Deltaproteobacteria bacterium]
QRSIGYLPENLPIYPEMTVADYPDSDVTCRAKSGHHAPHVTRGPAL